MPKPKAARKSNKASKPACNLWVCGRCGGHFANLGDFLAHVTAQACTRMDLILEEIEAYLAALGAAGTGSR